MKRATFVLPILLFAISCFAQQQQQIQQQEISGPPNAAAAASAESHLSPAEMKRNQQQARQLLQTAEAEARGLGAGMRALTLSQIGSAYIGVDQKKATALLHDAFTASTEIDSDKGQIKRFLQDRILAALLGLDPASVPELLPQAEPQSRTRAMGQLIGRAAQKKDFAHGMDLINQAAADSTASFPYDGVANFMLALPPDDYADRLSAFMQAYTSYSRETAKSDMFSNTGFDRIIVRFGTLLPKDMVMKAINEVLDRAKSSDDDARFTLSSSAGSASFNSSYDYFLFEFIPVIRKFDSAKADDLLQQDSALQGVVSKYPNGVTSLDPGVRDTPLQKGESSGMNFSISSNKARSSGSSGGPPPPGVPGPDMQQVIGQYQAEIERIRQLASKEPAQALSQAKNLPETLGKFPARVIGLSAVAGTAAQKEPATAHAAADEMLKSITNLPADQRERLLVSAANVYLKLKDEEAARKVIDLSLKTADELYETDSNADDPNQAIKGYWPSAALYAQCLQLAYKVEPDKVHEILAGVKDDEIRTWLRIAYALALTGNSPNGITTMVSRKGQNSIMMSGPSEN